MKSRQKVTRVQLNITANDEFSLLGIVTSEPDYKLSLLLNKKLKISLKNNQPVEFKSETGTDLHFSKFSDLSGAPELSYNLFSNKSGKDSLIKKLSNIDFFLQIHSSENVPDTEGLTATLRKIESITAVFVLNSASIKDKNLHYLIP
jgi:hypothetical protein